MILTITTILLFSTTIIIGSAKESALNDQISQYINLNVPPDNFIPDEIIVKFKDRADSAKINKINSKYGSSIKQKDRYSDSMTVSVPRGRTVHEMVKLYKSEQDVEYAEPNYIASALFIPNDPFYGYQWNFYSVNGINVPQAWNMSNGSGVIVAVIDTGVAYETIKVSGQRYYMAPDLGRTRFVQGWDFVNNDAHPNDDNSHGTHVAGTIAQSTNNGIGVAGVAYGASIMPIKVLDKNGNGNYYNVARGIRYAADNGAKVISMSLGGTSSSSDIESALNYSYNKGVTIIAAAGNAGAGGPASYPAAYDAYVIAVGATRFDGARASYSTTGNYVDIAAPGGDLSVDQNGDGYGDGILQQTFNPTTKVRNDFSYWFFQGTSMATPHVAGAAALLIANGTTGPDNVRKALEMSAKDMGATGKDPDYGYGILDANGALKYVP